MQNGADTLVQWFGWFGWFTGKVEAWLEAKAAEGWHLVKADRWLNRFHFKRGVPASVRICMDYAAQVTEEYAKTFEAAGWELVGGAAGWYIWRAEDNGDRRSEAFPDKQWLVERNNRILFLLGLAWSGLLVQWPIQSLLGVLSGEFFVSWYGKALIALYIVLLLVVTVSIGLTYAQIRRLQERKL